MWWVKRGEHVYIESNKHSFSIMVWGGIVGQTRTPLIKCPKILNSQSYVEMLKHNGIIDFYNGIGENAVFQQDGASCHTATSTCAWFAEKNVTLLANWPANSPDLSPIERIWGIAKTLLVKRFGMVTPIANEELERAVLRCTGTSSLGQSPPSH